MSAASCDTTAAFVEPRDLTCGAPPCALETLLARLDTLTWRLDRGECPPADEMDALADTARALGPTLDIGNRRRLADAVTNVTAALERACARLRERIVLTGTGRRAARAYAGAR